MYLELNWVVYFTYSSDVSKHYTRHVFQEDHIFLNRFATSRTQYTIKYIGVKIIMEQHTKGDKKVILHQVYTVL